MEESSTNPILNPKLSRRETARKRRTEHEDARKVVQNRCSLFAERSMMESPSISPVSLVGKHVIGNDERVGSIPTPGTILAEIETDNPRMKTTTRGALSEYEVAMCLARLGATIFTPVFGHDHKFDMIACWGASMSRVQVKTMRTVDEGSIAMNGASVVDRKGGKQWPKLTPADCDVIVGWYPPAAQAYAIKPSGLGVYTFRRQPPRNGQLAGIRFEEDYRLRYLEQLRP